MKTQELLEIPLAKLKPSAENSRTTVDKEADESLAKSVGALGIIVPLIVRRVGDVYELVAGHRRLKAAGAAKMATVPCLVKDIGEEEVHLQRVTENSEREEVPPIEEAEAIERLVKKMDGNVKEAAARLGKSPAHVAGRLDLLQLSPKVREAVKSGELLLTWALEFRRVSDHIGQNELLGRCLSGNYNTPKSVNDIRKLVENEYSLNLARAPFNKADQNLAGVGSCLDCPKRTGSQHELFEGLDSKSPDICRDRACFEAKVKDFSKVMIEAGKAGSAKVLTGPQADKAIEMSTKTWLKPKYLGLDATHGNITGHQAVKAAGEEALASVVTAVGRNGKSVKLYPAKELQALLEKHAKTVASSGPRKKKSEAEKKAEEKVAKQREADKKARELDEACQAEAAEQVAEKIIKGQLIKQPLLSVVASRFVEELDMDVMELLAKRTGWTPKEKKGKEKPTPTTLDIRKHFDSVVQNAPSQAKCVAYGLVFSYYMSPDDKKKAYASMGVDLEKAKATAKARLAEEHDRALAAKVRPDEKALAESIIKQRQAEGRYQPKDVAKHQAKLAEASPSRSQAAQGRKQKGGK